MSNQEIEVDTTEEEAQTTVYIFKKPFKFDGETITEIDLATLAEIDKKSMNIAINRWFKSKNKTSETYIMDNQFLLDVLALSMQQPFEYFDNIKGADYAILPLKVMNFLVV